MISVDFYYTPTSSKFYDVTHDIQKDWTDKEKNGHIVDDTKE